MRTRLKSGLEERRLFKVHADQCSLRVGDHVIAETSVGRDFASGKTLQAECRGLVEAVNWSPDDYALFIWIRVSDAMPAEN